MEFIYLFILRIHRQLRPRLERAMLLQSAVTLVTLPLPWLLQVVDAILPLANIAALLMLIVAVISGSRVAWRAGTRDGRLLAVWMLLFIPPACTTCCYRTMCWTWATPI